MNLQQLPKKNIKMNPSEFAPLSPCEYYEDQMNMARFVEKNNSTWCLNE